MSQKSLTFIGITIGSLIGGYIPALWGSGMFSFSSILFSGLGAMVGIYAAFKLGE